MDFCDVLQKHRSKFEAHRAWLRDQHDALRRSAVLNGAPSATGVLMTREPLAPCTTTEVLNPIGIKGTSYPSAGRCCVQVNVCTHSEASADSLAHRDDDVRAARRPDGVGKDGYPAADEIASRDLIYGSPDGFSMPLGFTSQQEAGQGREPFPLGVAAEGYPPTSPYGLPSRGDGGDALRGEGHDAHCYHPAAPNEIFKVQDEPHDDDHGEDDVVSHPETEDLFGGSPLNVHYRAALWSRRRNQKLLEKRQDQLVKEVEDCTFYPDCHGVRASVTYKNKDETTEAEHLGAGQPLNLSEMSSRRASEMVAGWGDHVQRQRRAREMAEEREERLFGRARRPWTGLITEPEPFNLACYDTVQQDQRLRRVLEKPLPAPKKGISCYGGFARPPPVGITYRADSPTSQLEALKQFAASGCAPPSVPPPGLFSTPTSAVIVESTVRASRALGDPSMVAERDLDDLERTATSSKVQIK